MILFFMILNQKYIDYRVAKKKEAPDPWSSSHPASSQSPVHHGINNKLLVVSFWVFLKPIPFKLILFRLPKKRRRPICYVWLCKEEQQSRHVHEWTWLLPKHCTHFFIKEKNFIKPKGSGPVYNNNLSRGKPNVVLEGGNMQYMLAICSKCPYGKDIYVGSESDHTYSSR